MKPETRIGEATPRKDDRVAGRAVETALRRFEGSPLRVRVRLAARAPNRTAFRVHVWRGYGPTVGVEKAAASAPEAIRGAADTRERRPRRRRRAARAPRRRALFHPTPATSRKESL